MQRISGHSMEFGWRFFTIVILHLTVCLTSICYVTAASIKWPGETTQSVEIEIGDSASITCNVTKDFNISSVWFLEENTKRKIVQPSSEITTVGEQTAILTIRNASEYQGLYQCMSGGHAIGMTKVYVGTPPTNVPDFKCRSYDYVYMICTFTKPANKVYVNYELFYKNNPDSQNWFKCELQTTEDTKFCNITSQTVPVYMISRPTYVFKLIGNNTLGIVSQKFKIKHFQNVIPAKLNVLLRNITSDSVSLSWNVYKYAHYEEEGLEYEIRLQPKGFNWYYATDYEQCIPVQSSCNVTIKNLTYPFREYTVRVRVKVKSAKDDDTMWSEPFIGTFKTEPRRPDAPPNTAVGSFYIDPNEIKIRLYWQQLTEEEENGPDFEYVVNKTDLDGNLIETQRTKEASITFDWNRDDKYKYYIKSSNSLGESVASSQIRVHPIIRREYFPQTIATVYHNRTYTLSWVPPSNQSELINYTIFWCLSKMESSNQCKGTIHFRYLAKHATNFTTEPQDHTLNLAVSANYLNSITGMQWAMCSADVSSDLMKLEPEATAESASTIKVHWSSERVCTSILKGYNLTYCQVTKNASSIDGTQATCSDSTINTVPLRGQREYVIKNLKPYTEYRIDMFMYSETKVGPTSDPIVLRTKEAAPSSPRNLQVITGSITSNSANISWLPPLESNGEIKFYTIWKIKTQTKEHRDHQILNVTETNASNETYSPIYFELKSLNSYSEYEVYITAHTVETSEKSNSTLLKTLIGIPTNPRSINLITEDNYGILNWQTPEMPSGRVDFYVVALLTKYKGKEEEDRQISLVNGQSCKFRVPECYDTISYYYLKVRAVNVAEKHEIDHSTFPNTKPNRRRRRSRRHTNPEISATVGGGLQTYESDILSSNDPLILGDTKYNEKQKIPPQVKDSSSAIVEYNDDDSTESNFQCLNTLAPINAKYAVYKNHLNDVDGSVNDEIKFFPSTWEDSIIYKCSIEDRFDFTVKIAVPVIMISGFLSSIFYWVRKKYNKMKNINAVLPEELVSHMPNYHLGFKNTEKDCSSDVSRSNDCLVAQKESHHLLSSICNGTANPLAHTNVDELKGSENKVVPLSSVCNEEQMSQSTNSVEMNDIYVPSSNDSSPARNENITGISRSLQHDIPVLENMVTLSNGYKKPQEILNSNLMCSTLPTTSSGYVLPTHVEMQLPQPQSTFNGYTTLDAMGKCILPNSMEIAPATPKLNEKISEQTELSTNSKEPDIENTPSRSSLPPSANSNNNNNNRNLICGYVTQKQLAEFGQLMH